MMSNFCVFADEANIEPDKEIKFQIYGGIIVTEELALELSIWLDAVKARYGIPKEQPIKWSNNCKFGKLEARVLKEIKDLIVKKVKRSDVNICVCFSPHAYYGAGRLKRYTAGRAMKSLRIQALQNQVRSFVNSVGIFIKKKASKGIIYLDRFQTQIGPEMIECINGLEKNGTVFVPDLMKYVEKIEMVDEEDMNLMQISDVVLGAICDSLKENKRNFLCDFKDNFLTNAKGKIRRAGIHVYPINDCDPWLADLRQELVAKISKKINEPYESEED